MGGLGQPTARARPWGLCDELRSHWLSKSKEREQGDAIGWIWIRNAIIKHQSFVVHVPCLQPRSVESGNYFEQFDLLLCT